MGVFGDEVQPAASAEPAGWIAARHGTLWTVGWLVPEGFERVVRVEVAFGEHHVGAEIGELCAAYTTSPGRTWAAVWEGYGFTSFQTKIAVFDTGPEARRYQQARQAELRREDEVRKAAISAELATIPTFDLPHRRYYLLTGTVREAAALRQLDLWWPEDQAWFVATDVDLDWCYVAGTAAFTDAVAAALPDRTRPADRSDPLA